MENGRGCGGAGEVEIGDLEDQTGSYGDDIWTIESNEEDEYDGISHEPKIWDLTGAARFAEKFEHLTGDLEALASSDGNDFWTVASSWGGDSDGKDFWPFTGGDMAAPVMATAAPEEELRKSKEKKMFRQR